MRSILRTKAKKLYKEQIKSVPKNQRISFAEFFKRYKGMKSVSTNEPEVTGEDFDFEDMINVNEISDGEVEVVEADEIIESDS